MQSLILFIVILVLSFSAKAQEFNDSQKAFLSTENILLNPSFEAGKTNWVNSGGTFSIDSTVFFKGKRAAKIVTSAQTMSLVQSSSQYASSAFSDGVPGLVSVKIKSNVAIKVCAVQAGVVSTIDCMDVPNTNKWGIFKIPTTLGSVSNGISIGSTVPITGTVYIDDAIVASDTVVNNAEMITDWVDFPSVAAGTLITATGGGFTSYGTVVNNKAQWRRVGSNMEIRWDYRQSATTGLVAGTGNYLFNLPSGYEMDINKVTVNSSTGATAGAGNDSSSLGSLRGTYGTAGNIDAQVYAYSSTQLKAYGLNSTSSSVATGYWGPSGTLDFAINAIASYNLSASVPIKGWANSINTVTQQCQSDTQCANEFSAKISSADVVSDESLDWVSGDCTNAGTGYSTCTFNSGIFTVAPNCTCTAFNTATNQAQTCKVSSQSASSVSFLSITNGGSSTDVAINVACQKQSTDYKARRAIVGSFQGLIKTDGVNFPIRGSAIVAAGTEATLCTTTGNCTLYRSKGNIFTSIAKTATTGSYTVTLDSTKINTSTASCNATAIRDTSGNFVCHTSSMGATFTVFCRDVTANATGNALFRVSCDGELP